MHPIKYLPVFLILIFSYNTVFAAAEDDFDKGVEYFKQKQYQQAVKAFTRSYKQGLKTPALFHNLGVSYYRLGNYPQAKKYFELARRYPQQRMLAEYNLGLVAKKQNKQALAKKHFKLVKKKARDKKLVTLARIQLGEAKALEPDQGWSAYTKLTYGHDDNITLVPDTSATKKSSGFTYLIAVADTQLYGHSKAGIELEGAVSSYDYVDYDRYDYSKYTLAIKGKFRTGSWRNMLGLGFQKARYGHKDYQKNTRFLAQTKTYITRDNSLRIRYTHDDISSLNPTYDYLAGTRQRLKTEWRNYGKNHYAKLYHQHERNDRANTVTANFSPTRNTLQAYYEYKLTHSLKLGAALNYRISTYPAKATTAEREDKRQMILFRLEYKFNNTWKMRGQIEQADNNSTNPAYTYQGETTSLSVIGYF